MSVGSVALVGAGPGDPRLITVRGLQLLRSADVVVHDRLVDARLLDEAPPHAVRIFAGKASGRHAMPQAEINAILVAWARRGRRVVRLKGGDPYVFGRGAEEAEALAAAGVLCEVVPGVSAAIAVPEGAGIPVTRRGVSSSFAIVTGHGEGCAEAPAVDWARVATATDTLVILMGLGTLGRIARELVAHGRAAETPVALIRAGTTPREETVVGTLADIDARAREAGLEPPVVIVVGEVVSLRAMLVTDLVRASSPPGADRAIDETARRVGPADCTSMSRTERPRGGREPGKVEARHAVVGQSMDGVERAPIGKATGVALPAGAAGRASRRQRPQP